MRTLLAILLLMLCWVAQGANYTNTTLVQSTIQGIIDNSAVDGDTIYLGAGAATWNSTLSITKCIYLIGHGTNTDGSGTIITAGTSGIIVWKPHANLPVRLSRIRVESGGSTSAYGVNAAVQIYGTNSLIRVDHCFFNTGDSPMFFNFYAGTSSGAAYGVIDHCTWRSIRRQMFSQTLNFSEAGAASWTWPMLPGTTNSVVLENDLFTQESDTVNGSGGTTAADCVIYGQYGPRVLVRYCQFRGMSNGAIDWHDGRADGPPGPIIEVYSNTIVHGAYPGAGSSSDIWIRGGQAIIHDNISDFSGPFVGLSQYLAQDVHTISNTFIWNNTGNSGAEWVWTELPSYCNCSQANIIQNVDFFNRAPQAGDGIFSFYPSTPRADGGWYQLAYPHPLVTAQDGGGGSPNPTAQLTPSSLAWVMNPGSGSSNKVFTIKNIGGGTLTGYVHFANP